MKFAIAFFAILVSYNLAICLRMRNSDNLLNKNIIASDFLFNNIRFKENNLKEGDWNNIMNKITDIAQGIKNNINIKTDAIKAGQRVQGEIQSLFNKSENKEQEKKFESESNTITNINGIDSKKSINYSVQKSISNDSDDDIKIAGDIGSSIKIKKKDIQSQIDSRYMILRPFDGIINSDKSIRFYVMDKTTKDTYIMKLYFKDDPKDGKFYNEINDPLFKDAIEDCKDSQMMTNRVYNKTIANTIPIIEGQDNTLYSNFEMTRCLSVSSSTGSNSALYGINTIPMGERLSSKCLHENNLDKDNSCIHYLKTITYGLLNGIKLLNSGNKFYKHGNIRPNNIYLYNKNDTQKIFLDNMIYDKNIYDDVNNKPFKNDFNMLGETLLQLLTGSSKTENILKKIPNSAFKIYYQIKKYFLKYSIDINLKIAALNVGEGIKDYLGKCVTEAEYEYKLRKSIFHFIYRLKCSGTNPTNQFIDLEQAFNHDFIKSAIGIGDKKLEDNWDINPCDY